MKRLLVALIVVAFSVIACDEDNGLGSNSNAGDVYVYMTDYQSAALGSFTVGDSAIGLIPLNELHTDATIRIHNNRVYIIERMGKDAIIVLDPANPTVPVANYSVGNGTNPQDMVFVNDNAYVLRHNTPNILVIDPATGDSTGTVDLSSVADADGVPEMVDGLLVGNTLYIVCQLLDQTQWFAPSGPGKVVAINTANGEIASVCDLTIENPESIIERNGTLYVTGGSWYDLATTGIDVFEIGQTQSSRLTAGAALSGRPTSIVSAGSQNEAWAVVSQTWPNGVVYGIDLTTGAIVDSLAGLGSPAQLVRSGAALIVSDRGETTSGVYVFDATSGDALHVRIVTPLTPDALAAF